MQCPECNTPNRDDAAFCGMCKRLFRTAPPRSSRPPPPASQSGSFWEALFGRLSGSSPPAAPESTDTAALHEVAAALQAACPRFWRSADLRISISSPASSVVSRGDDPHERVDLTPRLTDAIGQFARGHAGGVAAGRVYLVTVERQADGQWRMRCTVEQP